MGATYCVSAPHHGEGKTLWYLLDSDGDPVESCDHHDTADAWRWFLSGRHAVHVGTLRLLWPQCEVSKLWPVAVMDGGMIRPRK